MQRRNRKFKPIMNKVRKENLKFEKEINPRMKRIDDSLKNDADYKVVET